MSKTENANFRFSSYWVEQSNVSRNMICSQDEDGDISCVLGGYKDDIKFSIDHFSDNEDVLDDYMAKIFQEACLVDLNEGPTVDVCQTSLEQALS